MFKITRESGFHITFENGYTISVQFGPGMYCDNYNKALPAFCAREGSSTAECAVIKPGGGLAKLPRRYADNDEVTNRSTPKQVLGLMGWAARQK